MAVEKPSWNNVSAGSEWVDSGLGVLTGWGIVFEKTLGDNFFLAGRYREIDRGVHAINDFFVFRDIESKGYALRLGYRHSLRPQTDVYVAAEYGYADISYEAPGYSAPERLSISNDGYLAIAGLRTLLWPSLEAGAEISYFKGDVNLKGHVKYFLTDAFSFSARLANANSGSAMGLFFDWNF